MTEKTKRDAVIVAVLLGGLVMLLPRLMKLVTPVAATAIGAEQDVPPTAGGPAAAPRPTITPPLHIPDAARPMPEYTAQALRDPMVSLLPAPSEQPSTMAGARQSPSSTGRGTGVEASAAPSVVVEGVVWGGARPQALLNGQLYGIGDAVEGARIVSIARSEVTVEMAGREFVLGVQEARERASTAPRYGMKRR